MIAETGEKNNHMSLDKKKLDLLADTVRSMGALAKEKQAHVQRNYKDDGSVLTDVDLEISSIIQDRVNDLFPECTFVCEETPCVVKPSAPYTFVLDPIDGTDVFSQGLPSFAVALGVLDRSHNPVGAYISCPRFGRAKEELFIRLDPEGKLYVDDEEFTLKEEKDIVDQVTMGSNGLDNMDFSKYEGKVRVFGSAIIHLISPVIFPNIEACVNQPCYVWDITASHAVLKAVGMDIVYCDGKPFEYTNEFIYHKTKFRYDIYAGTPKGIEFLKTHLPRKAQ